MDEDEIPTITPEVSTISLSVKADCAALERAVMEKAREKFPMQDKLWLKDVRCGLCGGRQYHRVRVCFGIGPKVPVAPCPCILKGLAKSFAVSYRLDLFSLKVSFAGPAMTVVGQMRAAGSAHIGPMKQGLEADFAFKSMRIMALEEGGRLNFEKLPSRKQVRVDVTRPCKVILPPFKIPVPFSDLLVEKIPPLIGYIEKQVDTQLEKQFQKDHLTPQIAKGWQALHGPFELKKGSRAWLVPRPEEIWIAQPHGTGTTLETTVTLRARPKIVLGDEPVVPRSPMPTVRVGGAERGLLRLYIEAVVPRREAARMLNGELKKVKFDDRVMITNAEVFASRNRLGLELSLTRPFTGVLYLVGTPRYDADTNELYVDGLDYMVETRNLLVRSADWLLHSRFVEYLQAKARWPVRGKLEKVIKEIKEYEHELVKKDENGVIKYRALLKGKATSFGVLGVYGTREDATAIVEARGTAELILE
ncbi:MAG TPA: DUF4403 family protein [Planctomycetota bacterium]|nr:DUF4403 family protein [Planctomycetota bacterium]